ncbi:hypothetical protein ACF068_01460 [Streptomyces sp. NPDC016309]|uniref:hypothetical protein n=1 Tax=Streptomyces sp. NPDC016309 TaxID=3364965 RepID=UPI0036F695BA
MNATSPGALLLCRADTASVRAPAPLLREPLLLAPAGPGWTVLVPEGGPWRDGTEPVDRVAAGWAGALGVAGTWPVVALWWDEGRAGCILATGFRRPVGYTWLADGTPAGEDEAMHTFAARLGLDPVLDVQDLEPLIRPDPHAAAPARLLGLTAVLTRHGLTLPPGLTPGAPASRLWAAAEERGAEPVAPATRPGGTAPETPRPGGTAPETPRPGDTAPESRPGRAAPAHRALAARPHGPRHRARALATAQLAAGLPLLAWALTRRSPGWATTAVLLIARGTLGLAHEHPPYAPVPAGS